MLLRALSCWTRRKPDRTPVARPKRRLHAFGMSGPERFVQLHHWMLDSPAWNSLSLPARCLLIEILKRYNGYNNGQISFSHREASEILGVGKNQPVKFFRELEDRGFIKANQRGHFAWKGGKATTWNLTAVGCGDKAPTKEFMRWGKN